ncbi:barstar family protein [Nocardia puris]|uniref:Barstar (Barnase inhibitor) n=1 Tax=Nocardia puris TaxID=208602 RepID=A0A366D871_9NOCA|nr:barstar family protein [Nocardia puris]MBF6212424.1 barstar family protein [Nocardia puris]MBF6366671.1 barstar family protein [Nocardia puris]MBF6461013.1 barstar family protein [Nocardia puris]RBO85664.1 barstar (barnase inhibitor) [Nocardia puris]
MTRTVPLSQFLARETAPEAPAAPADAVVGALPVAAPELSEVRYRAPTGYVVRELRGPKMRDTAGVFDEWAAAFQFPYYFGANKDAFDECLRDLDDFVGDAAGYVAVIRDSADLLTEQPDERGWFTEAMRDCADYWRRRDVLFRVVCQGPAASPHVVPLSLD